MNPALKIISNKKVLIPAIVLVVLVAAFFFIKLRRKTLIGEINSLEVDLNSTTISEDEAMIIAQNLLNAMNRWGTKEDVIIQNLENLNRDDLLLVIRKFGIKPYSGGVLATMWHQKKFMSTDQNLIGWLQDELNGSSLKQVKAIFDKNGIPF